MASVAQGLNDSISYKIIVVIAVFLPIAVVSVVLRLHVRRNMMHALGVDDVLMFIALLATILYVAFVSVAIHHGFGRHVMSLSYQEAVESSKYLDIALLANAISTAIARSSIAIFLKRLLVTKASNPLREWALYSLIALITGASIVYVVAYILMCTPTSKIWDPAVKGTCGPEQSILKYGRLIPAIGIFSDLVLALLPIALLWEVRINRLRKTIICCLMGLGLLTCGIMIAKLVVQNNLSPGSMKLSNDPQWNNLEFYLLAVLEQCFLIILGTVPTIQPLVQKWRHRNDPVMAHTALTPETPSAKTKHRSIKYDGISIPPIKTYETLWQGPFLEFSGETQRDHLERPYNPEAVRA